MEIKDKKKINYIIILLESGSTSFCHYNIPQKGKSPKIIPFKLLNDVVNYAKQNEIYLNVIYGQEKIPVKHQKLIDSSNHVKIKPVNGNYSDDDSILVINPDDISSIVKISKSETRNLILRISKKELKKLNKILLALSGKFHRLNLSLTDVDEYKEEEINEYEKQLTFIEKNASSYFSSSKHIEIDFITDRIFLNEMHNCNPGIEHLTYAPNGKFYLCPGFYYDNHDDYIGSIQEGIIIKNKDLLFIENAPICSLCDAFQCKRCMYLNEKLTLEINTPSRQQCVIAHLSRNSSKNLLEEYSSDLQNKDMISAISELDYLDPFEIVEQNQVKRFENYLNKHRPKKDVYKLPAKVSKTNISEKDIDQEIAKGKSKQMHKTLPPLEEIKHSKIKEIVRKSKLLDTNNQVDKELVSVLKEILSVQKDILIELKRKKNG